MSDEKFKNLHEQWYKIKFEVMLKKKMVAEMKEMLDATYNESAKSQADAYRWYNSGRSVELIGRLSAPTTALTEQTINTWCNHDPRWSSFNCETTCLVASHLDRECAYFSFDQTWSSPYVCSMESTRFCESPKNTSVVIEDSYVLSWAESWPS